MAIFIDGWVYPVARQGREIIITDIMNVLEDYDYIEGLKQKFESINELNKYISKRIILI